MFKLMGKEINAIFGVQIILIWTYEADDSVISNQADLKLHFLKTKNGMNF